MSTERCGVYCGGERCCFCGSLKLAGLTPSSTRRAVAYDAAHQVVARFDVTAADAYNGMGGYWSLFRLADACKTRYLPGAVSVTWDDAAPVAVTAGVVEKVVERDRFLRG